ncbi:hypothetical protein ACPCSE_29605 [Streptomyces cellulosae]
MLNANPSLYRDRADEIERLFLQDQLSAPKIAERTGVPDYQVRLLLKERGHDLSKRRSQKELRLPEVMPLLEQRMPLKEIAKQTSIPYATLRRWLQEEGVDTGANDPDTARREQLIDEVVARYENNEPANAIADALELSHGTVLRWLHERGVTIRRAPLKRTAHKKIKHLDEVLRLHREEGKTTSEISALVPVSRGTVEAWLRDAGEKPRYNNPSQKKTSKEEDPRRQLVLSLYRRGSTWKQIVAEAHVAETTARGWVAEAGIQGEGGKAARDARKRAETIRLAREENLPIMEICAAVESSYYKVREWLDEAGVRVRQPGERTPEGIRRSAAGAKGGPRGRRAVTRPAAPPVRRPRNSALPRECAAPDCSETFVSPTRKYHNDECRTKWAKRREADPNNHITYTCQNETCGKEFTRPKSGGTFKYCSNACAQRHTKTKQHVVVEDAVVLDSSYETLLWSLCRIYKIPVERYDRAGGVEWREGGWYAPDLLVKWQGRSVTVETKGLADPEDEERWAAFRAAKDIPLVVLQQKDLVPPPATREDLLKLLHLA